MKHNFFVRIFSLLLESLPHFSQLIVLLEKRLPSLSTNSITLQVCNILVYTLRYKSATFWYTHTSNKSKIHGE